MSGRSILIDRNNNFIDADGITSAIRTIDYPHHEIHSGSSYVITNADTDVDNASPKYWSIVTPNTTKFAHFTFEIFANAAGIVEFFEAPTSPTGGTTLTAYNRNRNSTNTSVLTVRYDRTNSGDGARIGLARVGTAGNPAKAIGGNVDTRGEFILKQNTEYLIKFTSDADNNIVWIVLDWYEHINII